MVAVPAAGSLPIANDLFREAADRGVEIVARPAAGACDLLAAVDPNA